MNLVLQIMKEDQEIKKVKVILNNNKLKIYRIYCIVKLNNILLCIFIINLSCV